MAYKSYRVNKKSGVTYVYEVHAFWDKEKKQSRAKQICIGKLDKETGEFIPSKRRTESSIERLDSSVTATSKMIGPTAILDSINEEYEIEKTLKKAMPNSYKQILTLAYYLAAKGEALSRCESWTKLCDNPFDNVLTSQRISEILTKQSEGERQAFFSKWIEKISTNDFLCYDITSVSSYSEQNEFVKYGYNRDGEKLEQINLGMLFSQQSKIPVYYKRLPGNIPDVSTLKNFVSSLDYLNSPNIHLVMDRGFFSVANIDEMIANKHKFTIGVPLQRKWVMDILESSRDDMDNMSNYRVMDDDSHIFMKTHLYKWGKDNKRTYLHIYFDSSRAFDAEKKYADEILGYKIELETGKRVKEHEEMYDRYFKIRNTPKRGLKVEYDEEAIKKHKKKYVGYFVILTNVTKDPMETLDIYRNKDVVEKSFDDLKNSLDMKRLRVHLSERMNTRLFIQFIALIFTSAIREKIKKNTAIKNYTVRGLLDEMQTISKIKYSGRYGEIITEISKKQRDILEAFAVKL